MELQTKEKHGLKAIGQVDMILLQSDNILTIALYEGNKLIINPTKTDVKAMIEGLKNSYSISNDKPVTINTLYDFDAETVFYIDKILISAAVGNLIDNAIKYSGDSVIIIITCAVDHNILRISVTDNGYGIADKDQPTIFEKFNRGAAVKRNEAKGFGLGLTYIKIVAEMHGGTVKVYSRVKKGSEFSILIPTDKKNHTNELDNKRLIL